MQNLTGPPILNLAAELQIECFCALGDVDGTLADAFHMATTNRKLYAVYRKHCLEIDRQIITKSDVLTYDILLIRSQARWPKMLVDSFLDSWAESPDSRAESSEDLQDFNESILPRNITLDDICKARGYWKSSAKCSRGYLRWMGVYRSSPFPYKWSFPTKLSIIPFESLGIVRARPTKLNSLLPSTFKARFHKASVRSEMLKHLMILEKMNVKSNLSGIYREWFNKISNRNERWSFLEYLEGLEMTDFGVGFLPWLVDLPLNKERSRKTQHTREETDLLWIHEQRGLLTYPNLADWAVEPPDSLKRLISSKGLPKDVENSLIQAWPSFRRNWPQTARCTVFTLNSSGEALAKLEEWVEAGSGAVTVPREEGSGIQQ